jgi:hypothetical protein
MDHPISVIGKITDMRTGKFYRDPSRVQKAKGVLDDISLLTTIRFGMNKNVEWKIHTVKMVLQEAVDLCHANGIQLIGGYSLGEEGSMVSSRGKKFVEWLRNPYSPTFQQHAADIMEILWGKKDWGLDGVGFDVELNGLRASDADNFCAFYGELAKLLAAKDKILTVATGVGIGGADDERSLLGTFCAQPFRLALGHPNVIIRPMAYDNFVLDDAGILKWHQDIVDYALVKVGLQPGQLQLGIKTSNNVSPRDPSWKAPPGWTSRKCCFNSQGVKDRCVNVLAPKKVGVINFAGWVDFKSINEGLNPHLIPSGTVGQPLQVPLKKPVA